MAGAPPGDPGGPGGEAPVSDDTDHLLLLPVPLHQAQPLLLQLNHRPADSEEIQSWDLTETSSHMGYLGL